MLWMGHLSHYDSTINRYIIYNRLIILKVLSDLKNNSDWSIKNQLTYCLVDNCIFTLIKLFTLIKFVGL